MDTGKYKEVPCNHFQMTFGDTTLQLLVHKTEQAWAPQQDLLDVSEKLTGYRLTTTGKSVSSSSMKDVERVVKEFVEDIKCNKSDLCDLIMTGCIKNASGIFQWKFVQYLLQYLP